MLKRFDVFDKTQIRVASHRKKHVAIPQRLLVLENSNLLCTHHLLANSQCLLQHSKIDLTIVPKDPPVHCSSGGSVISLRR